MTEGIDETRADKGDFFDHVSVSHPFASKVFRYFKWSHLPPHLQDTSVACYNLAASMIEELPDSPELTAGLRKLLEAKDCFVRAALDKK